ncbi:MAG TPA: glycosyltransferase family 39 protein, partial [Thermoclostridium caenicola]|nr:glycosyltransferase family 39 protein [Thermoclostridium caenicola]
TVQSSKLSRGIYAFLAVGVTGIFLLIGVFAVKTYADIFTTGRLFFLAVSLVLTVAVLFAGSRLDWGNRLSFRAFALLTAILTLAPRLFWVYAVGTVPFSDFLHLHNYGVAVALGDFTNYVDFYACFPFKFGFGFLVGGLYALFGPHFLVVELFNVLLSLVQVLLVYRIAWEIRPESARPAALFYALWPAQIMYCTVVAAENSFLVPFLAAIYVLIRFFKYHTQSSRGYALLVLAGTLTAIAQALRPMAMVLVPAAAVCILFFITYHKSMGRNLARKALCILLVSLSYFVVLKFISLPIKELSGIDITRSGTGYNFLVGTNYEANGMFNQEDFSIIAKYDFDFDRVHSEAGKLAVQRIKEDPVRFLKLAVKKVNFQWGKENYGYYWSVISAGSGTGPEGFIKDHPRAFYAVSQLHYLMLLLLAVSGCYAAYRRKILAPALLWLVIGAMFLAYSFLEVQPRYHMPAVPLFIILAGLGAAEIKGMLTKEK